MTASALASGCASAATVNPAPRTVPSIQRWTGGTGTLTLTTASRIVVRRADASALSADARTFAADLADETGLNLPVVTGSAPRSGDIFVELDTTTTQAEGYTAAIGAGVTIHGRTAAGVFHGEQTIEQILALSPDHRSLPLGTAVDWPTVAQRGVMIDVGRHFWSVADLKAEIRQMSWYKLNDFHVHFTDNDGFRLQSTTYPNLADPGASYSHADIADLVSYAAEYHVTLLPEIDLPAHSAPILAAEPSLAWQCPSMASPGSQNNQTLDITNPAALTYVTNLLKELVPLFPNSPTFHTGGDEYPDDTAQQSCPELVRYAADNHYPSTDAVFVGFTNQLDTVVRGLGKRMEVWNWWDALNSSTAGPNKDVLIDDWTADPTELLQQGYEVVLSSQNWYITPGLGLYPDDAALYSSWTPSTAAGVHGYEVSLWGDYRQTMTDAAFDSYLHRPLELLADRTWGGPLTASSNYTFEDDADAIGTPPGVPQYAPPGGTLLAGTAYGTSPAWENGPNTYQHVFDGDVGTFFDYSQADGGYAGLDLGTPQQVTRIRFVPRPGQEQRMVGGLFQGCTTGPDSGCVTLATVTDRPTDDWFQLPVTDTGTYRWVRYVSPAGGFANIAEAQFWGPPATGTITAGTSTTAGAGSGHSADPTGGSTSAAARMDR
ncbi:family 20 glycosylhydrolase [Kitasatospora sp. NPDC001539]|uniref:family 20 glycosylhydrolase n=1 Tax=Kitasatospora sp. NPDC001539 TaxID=3154384 RepID=UPI00331BEDC0